MVLKQSPYGRRLTLSLPSGIKVKARRPSVLSLIASGGFPSELTLEVWKLVKKDLLDPDKIANDVESVMAWAKMIDAYVPHVLINPVLVTGADEDTVLVQADDSELVTGKVNIRDITDIDKQTLFLFGQGVVPADEELAERGFGGRVAELAATLKEFRGGAARDEAGRGVEEVRAEAVSAPGTGPGVAAGA